MKKMISIMMCSFLPLFLSATQNTSGHDNIPYDLHDEHDNSSEEELDDDEDELDDL